MSDAVTAFLATKGVIVPEEFLAHYGVPGMRWGRRKSGRQVSIKIADSHGRVGTATGAPGVSKRELKRSVNAKPNLTTKIPRNPTPPKRLNTLAARPQNRKTSDAELKSKINRLQLEKQLKDLTSPANLNQPVKNLPASSPKADKFLKATMKEIGKQAVKTIATRAVSVGIEIALGKAAGKATNATTKALLEGMVAAGAGKKGGKGK